MLSNPMAFNYHLKKFYDEKVLERKKIVASKIDEIASVVFDVLKEVEIQEPRFISQLNEVNGRFEGISVISPTEYEVTNRMIQLLVNNLIWIINILSGGFVFESNGCVQFCGRQFSARLRTAQAERWQEAVHVIVGWVYHRLGLLERPEDTSQILHVGGAGVREVCLQGPGQTGGQRCQERRHRGQAACARPVHGACGARIQVQQHLAAERVPVAHRQGVAASDSNKRGQTGGFSFA